MPEVTKKRRATKAKRRGKSASTQAGKYVHEEIKHVREGRHGARSAKQAIAIGLSKARRAGVKLPPPKRAKLSTRRSAQTAMRAARKHKRPSPRRARATERALRRESRRAASRTALSRQARAAAKRRGAADRKRAARKAARTRARRRTASA